MRTRGSPAKADPRVEPPDYSPISLLGKKSPGPAGSHQAQFQPVEITSPETLLQTDISQEEFAHSLLSSIDLIPDVPYELDDYKPQNPMPEPNRTFPQAPNMRLLQPDFFRRYDASTLFYIFFYFPGSPQQSFAGRELKQRGWKFHTKYQTWFRRVGEPAQMTPEYEIGTFEYFDHTGLEPWVVRERTGFRLEYEHLETE
jgi:CCR4-NOT transcription complex subunit 3